MNERKTERKTVALELTRCLLILSQGWRGLARGIGRSGKSWNPGPQCPSLSLMSGSTSHSGDMQKSPEFEIGQETVVFFSPFSSLPDYFQSPCLFSQFLLFDHHPSSILLHKTSSPMRHPSIYKNLMSNYNKVNCNKTSIFKGCYCEKFLDRLEL